MSDHRRKRAANAMPQEDAQTRRQPHIRVLMIMTALEFPRPSCPEATISFVLGNSSYYGPLIDLAGHRAHLTIAGGCKIP